MNGDARDAAERVAREQRGKLVAFLAARCGDVHAAEDALADAFAAALTAWPRDGVPRSPEAWLLVAARRRLIDDARRAQTRIAANDRLALAAREAQSAFERRSELPDERLGLMFACAHPALAENVRAPLILQTVLGIDAERIASAFLVAPAAMSQRLVRAKRKIATLRIPLRVPPDEDLLERTGAVLDAIYAAFTAGWEGDDDDVRGLDEEAVWLARFVVAELPDDPEALGLLALMRYCASRRAARRDARGAFVPLAEQDVRRWDSAAIKEAEALLVRASAHHRLGRYQLEAAIQSAHATRHFGGATDWRAILTLYDALVAMTGSVLAAVNRAVAVGEVFGARTGVEALDALDADPRLRTYQPYWAARAALHAAAGDRERAAAAYSCAIGLARDPAVRAYLTARAASLTFEGHLLSKR
ncbi:MAG TPA: DUF6596 domain-containing protein [Candidatus Acidoferrum sp.]|nr:DUF6596 domain-containing protein [Candidatus Acidoferrum sp.]